MKASRRADSWPERNQIGQRASRTADRVELLLVIFRDIVIERARPVTLFRCGVRRHFSYLSDDQMERSAAVKFRLQVRGGRRRSIASQITHSLKPENDVPPPVLNGSLQNLFGRLSHQRCE